MPKTNSKKKRVEWQKERYLNRNINYPSKHRIEKNIVQVSQCTKRKNLSKQKPITDFGAMQERIPLLGRRGISIRIAI